MAWLRPGGMKARRLADWTSAFTGAMLMLVGLGAACMVWRAEAGTATRDVAILVAGAMAAASLASFASAYRDEVEARSKYEAALMAYVSENVANAARLKQNHQVNANVMVDGQVVALAIPLFRMQTQSTRAYSCLTGITRDELGNAHARLMLQDQFNALAGHAAEWSSALFASAQPRMYQVEAARVVCASVNDAAIKLRTHYGPSSQPAA